MEIQKKGKKNLYKNVFCTLLKAVCSHHWEWDAILGTKETDLCFPKSGLSMDCKSENSFVKP